MKGRSFRAAAGALACLTLLCGMVLGVPAGGKAEAQEGKRFTILHTNDEHSELIPYGPASDYPDYPTAGGFSRLAHEIARIKAEKAAAGEPVLTLSGGDFSQGSLFGWLESRPGGHAELSLFQAMGYDAVALGNHEFDMGAGYRAMVLNQAKADGVKLPLLCANIRFDDANPQAAALKALYSAVDKQGTELAIQPYTVKTLPNGLKVGIIGLLGVEAEAVAPNAAKTGVTFGNVVGNPTDPVSFINRVIVVQNMVNTLRAAGCDVVVALSHSGTNEEKNLAKFVDGLDVIVGGHSHDLNYPPLVVDGTVIVQAGSYASHLGMLELEYSGGKVSVRNAASIAMNDDIPTVPAVDAAIAAYKAALDAATGMDVLAPMAETDLDADGGFNLTDLPPLVETNLGDLVTDAYRAVATMVNPAEPADIGFEANGVIRSGIPKGGLGRFSFYDLYRVVPLGATPDNTQPVPMGYPMVSFHLYGAEILGVLEATLDMGRNDFFVQLSGARYECRPAAPKGKKVTAFELDDGTGGWQPIDPAGLYKVATNFYTASFLELFGVSPRTSAGAVTTVLNSRVLVGPKEVKCWEALAQYVMNMPDLDGDGLPNIPPDYKYPRLRIMQEGWHLAEGSTGGGMETFVLVQNPTGEAVRVNVKFQTDTGEVEPPELQGVGIPAGSRRTFKVNDWVPDEYNVSAKVEPIDGEVVCERAMYGGGRAWAHGSMGATAPSPAQEWFLAEGATDGGMETWLLVQNPYDSAVHVSITFQTKTGPVSPEDLQGVEIPARSRSTFNVGSYVIGYDVSTTVEAEDGRVVCERAMYGGGRAWAHGSMGATAPSDTWHLAEGSTGGGMETFVLVQNPTGEAVRVNVKFQTDTGEVEPPELQGVEIPAGSRRTFKVNDWVPDEFDVSTTVEAEDGRVVCERAMYGGGRAWAHGSMGATAPSDTWHLAEGSTGGGMETFVLVQNSTGDDVRVNIAFQTGNGKVEPAALRGVTVPAHSRRTFKVNDWVPDEFDVSTTVEAEDGEVVCERAMYGGGRAWAQGSVGYAPRSR